MVQKKKFRDLTFADRLYIEHIPTDLTKKEILMTAAGTARVDYHLIQMGYKVYSTDFDDRNQNNKTEYEDLYAERCNEYGDEIDYYNNCDIFDLNSFPVKKSNVVMCMQTLEHLQDYKTALKNLLELASEFVIFSVPCEKHFFHPHHKNFWSDGRSGYKDIREFIELASPYKVSFSKGITKMKDFHNPTTPRVFIVTIDKRTTEESSRTIKDYTPIQLKWD